MAGRLLLAAALACARLQSPYFRTHALTLCRTLNIADVADVLVEALPMLSRQEQDITTAYVSSCLIDRWVGRDRDTQHSL